MKKRVVSMLMAGAMMLSCFVGVTMSANASTADTSFCVNDSLPESFSEWRDKSTTTKVYVYPKSGPNVRYMVQGRIRPVDEPVGRSAAVIIPVGVKGSITNTVRENAGTQARLKFAPTAYVQKFTEGVWSPDSTQNYTVYP